MSARWQSARRGGASSGVSSRPEREGQLGSVHGTACGGAWHWANGPRGASALQSSTAIWGRQRYRLCRNPMAALASRIRRRGPAALLGFAGRMGTARSDKDMRHSDDCRRTKGGPRLALAGEPPESVRRSMTPDRVGATSAGRRRHAEMGPRAGSHVALQLSCEADRVVAVRGHAARPPMSAVRARVSHEPTPPALAAAARARTIGGRNVAASRRPPRVAGNGLLAPCSVSTRRQPVTDAGRAGHEAATGTSTAALGDLLVPGSLLTRLAAKVGHSFSDDCTTARLHSSEARGRRPRGPGETERRPKLARPLAGPHAISCERPCGGLATARWTARAAQHRTRYDVACGLARAGGRRSKFPGQELIGACCAPESVRASVRPGGSPRRSIAEREP